MRVLVFGGRTFANRRWLFKALDRLHANTELGPITCIIEGEADGADKLARKWAEENGIPIDPYPADWKNLNVTPCVTRRRYDGLYNAAAGGIRNQLMLDQGKPDIAISFPGAAGTADMTDRIHAAIRDGAKIKLFELRVPPQ